ncbi:MAG: hypothetical protein ACODAD_03765 [Planctomycetota bacterium]
MVKYFALLLCVNLIWITSMASAMPPSETLLPDTTKGYLSVPDVERLQAHWERTQLGRLTRDPLMQPFIEDVRVQIATKLTETRARLGLTLEDLENLYGGELCIAMLKPEGGETEHATALLVDATDHLDAVHALLDKVNKRLLERGATRRREQLGESEATVFTMPKRWEDSPTMEACYVVHEETLLVCSHLGSCRRILSALNGTAEDTLADVEAFQATMRRCARGNGNMQPHIRWFVDPFGYAYAVRAAAGGRRREGVDLVKVLRQQGFGAVQGVGGHVFLATGDQDVLHRTMIHAPPVEQAVNAAGDERYARAARMLDFPNSEALPPHDFVYRDVGSYFTFNWKMTDAFEYSKTLVNKLLGGGEDDDLMEEIIVGLAKDKDGPEVDLRKDLVAHFGERISVISDCRQPITPESERLMFAIELTDPEAVRATIAKAFVADPMAVRRESEGHVIWEIVRDEEQVEVEEVEIEGDFGQFDPFGTGGAPEVSEEQEETRILPNSAITVAHSHLMVASHVDFIDDMLRRPLGTDLLTEAADYQQVQDNLEKIGVGRASFRFFARTDETYRPTYELIRQGKMPEAKTLLGKLLNRLWGPDEEGILREQQVDGSKMPEFDAVRRYFGPSGMYVRSVEDGWFMAGCLLSKQMP